jgi:hydroxymethylpyrimidine/phosphomethylpyrimidine kinase
MTLIHQLLVPQAHVLVMSQPELARFADCWRDPGSVATVAEDAAELTAFGCGHVLVTGIGGGDGVRADNLYDADGLAVSLSWAQHLPGPFLGAGATLSGALAARMAQGLDAMVALAYAQEYTTGALQHACRFGMGRLIPDKLYRTAAPAPDAPVSNDQDDQEEQP